MNTNNEMTEASENLEGFQKCLLQILESLKEMTIVLKEAAEKANITNNFQGANINNLVINGNMVKSGPDQFHNTSSQKKSISSEQMVSALKQCGDYIWG